MTDRKNYGLKAHNTFGIDACCERFMEYESVEEACQVASVLTTEKPRLLIVGRGSNLLLTGDFDGVVVHSAMKGVEVLDTTADDVVVRVGSGETWDDFVALCLDRGWYGAENLSLIPGEVGASAVQNIGAYGVEVSQLILRVEAVRITDGKPVVLLAEDCCYGYRMSRFKEEWKNQYLITYVVYRLSLRFVPRLDYGNIRQNLSHRGIGHPTPLQLRQTIIDIRNQKLPDPQVEGNAGSFFVNPVVPREKYEQLLERYPQMPHYAVDAGHEKIPAGWMIEQCGWKGRTVGHAGVHEKQALVLVNKGGATGAEIVNLCRMICEDVRAKFGIVIKPEVNIV